MNIPTENFQRRDVAIKLKQPLKSLWKEIIPKDCTLVVIYSSLIHFTFPFVGLEEVLVEFFLSLVDKGLTLVFPAFNFSFCQGTPYHYHNSKPQTGVLAEWLLKSKGVKRTPHPIYSFAVVGPQANQLMECENTTTFGASSTFEFFENQNAEIVMFGGGWGNCSQLHRYEELNKVPYRYYKEFVGFADFGNGEKEVRCKMFVRNLEINAYNNFSQTSEAFQKSSTYKSVDFCQGEVTSMNIVDLAEICKSELANNPLIFLEDRKKTAQRLKGLK